MRCTAGQSFLSSRRKEKEHMRDQNAQSLQMTDLQSFKWLKIKDSPSWTIKKKSWGIPGRQKQQEKKRGKGIIYHLFLTCCIFSLSSYFPMEQRNHQSFCRRRLEKACLKMGILNQGPRGTWSSSPTSTTATGLLCLCLGACRTQACEHITKRRWFCLKWLD